MALPFTVRNTFVVHLLPLVAALGCLHGDRLVDPVSTIARLVLTPDRAVTGLSGDVQFEVVGFTASGDTAPIAPVWSVARGTMIGTSGKDLTSGGGGKKIGHYKAGNSPGPDTVIVEDSSGMSDTSIVDVQPAAVATVEVTPATAEVGVGGSVQLTATTKDSAGNTLTGRQVLWSTSDGVVATVSSGGVVAARSAGTALITATSEGRSGSASVTATAGGTRSGYYVAPSGSASGDGSAARPWNLATALAHPAAVQPGDTIWLRGGTYVGAFTSRLTGTAAAPIIVRRYPGEHARIEGKLSVQGSYTWYWGFEVANTNPNSVEEAGITVLAAGTRFINLVVHDHSGQGMGVWSVAPDAEVYGCLIYNNGFDDGPDPLGHGIYSQNQTGTKRLEENVVFNQYGYGLHIYGSSAAYLKNFLVAGNVLFNNGLPGGRGQPNILVGGGTPAEGIVVEGNATYHVTTESGAIWFGYTAQSVDVVVRNNYLVGGAPALRVYNWTQATVTGNTIYTPNTIMVQQTGGYSGYQWTGNTYYADAAARQWTWSGATYLFEDWRTATRLGAGDTYMARRPSDTRVFVRPNRYEPGRGTIVVYNWALASSVAVDVSSLLRPGDRYEVRNVQDFFGSPVVSGTYAGGTIQLPMSAIQPPAPLGAWRFPTVKLPTTGPEFNVFVLLRPGT